METNAEPCERHAEPDRRLGQDLAADCWATWLSTTNKNNNEQNQIINQWSAMHRKKKLGFLTIWRW